MSIEDSQSAGAEQATGTPVTSGDAPSPASPPTVIVPPVPAEHDQAAQEIDVLSGHVHELEVKLNERDAEILSLRAKLDAQAPAGEVTCPTCGTRTEVTHG